MARDLGVRKNFVYATVFSDPARGVVIDMAHRVQWGPTRGLGARL